MKKLELSKLNKREYSSLLERPQINFEGAMDVVKPILAEIREEGLSAVLKYAKRFEKLDLDEMRVSQEEIDASESFIDEDLKSAINTAKANIEKFHAKQKPEGYELETMPGVRCGRFYNAIENVGLYVPGGTAPLFSTLLMLSIPAKLAGCERIVLCTPSQGGKVVKEILYAAKIAGVEEIYRVGGAQAVGLMAYGAEGVDKVDKIFGPGNQYVTAAKALVSMDPLGCSIDMPAGPSEVLVIADEYADAGFVAVDLLSQAEHGADSQVILISTSRDFANKVEEEVKVQLDELPRKELAEKSLSKSLILIAENVGEAFQFSNKYAPEHLILQIKEAKTYLGKVKNAGSVFIGSLSPESVGDYASGTNHSLPTYGYARSYSGVNLLSFMKGITYQELSDEGIKNIGASVIKMAEAEQLDAHANAVKLRLK
jgi:histidinol dehydrogenase